MPGGLCRCCQEVARVGENAMMMGSLLLPVVRFLSCVSSAGGIYAGMRLVSLMPLGNPLLSVNPSNSSLNIGQIIKNPSVVAGVKMGVKFALAAARPVML